MIILGFDPGLATLGYGIIKTDVASWIKFYAAFTVIIGGLIFWIYKIFHKKKHVISK